LLSVNQICDKGYKVVFTSKLFEIRHALTSETLLKGTRFKDIYIIKFDKNNTYECLVANNEFKVWHRRLRYVHMRLVQKLTKHGLVRGLSKGKFVDDLICDSCKLGKIMKSSFENKEAISTS
jgi:hypothetical protein